MSEGITTSIWRFVEPEEFELPVEPASKKARSFLQKLFSGFSEKYSENGAEAVQAELKSAPRSLIDWLSPYPNWQSAPCELNKILEPWLEDDSPDDLFRVFVGQYGSGLREMLSMAAQEKKWEILQSPDYQQLCNNDFGWLKKIPEHSETPLVIPRLESFFLRHYNGLEHIRKLVSRLFRNKQRCVISCNSWLWQYLESAMHIRQGFSRCYYMQSFSAHDLQTFFGELEAEKMHRPTVFRQADNGSLVLPLEMTGKGQLKPESFGKEKLNAHFPSIFLKKLAVESRGIPLVAWSIWRNSLKLAPDEDVADMAKEVADKDVVASASAKTIWVKAFEDVETPQIPADIGQPAAFLLMYLLQHDGLSSDAIFDLLNFEKDRLIGLLTRLQNSGIIVNENELWRASWQGYPAIRRFLAEQDHLQDAM